MPEGTSCIHSPGIAHATVEQSLRSPGSDGFASDAKGTLRSRVAREPGTDLKPGAEQLLRQVVGL